MTKQPALRIISAPQVNEGIFECTVLVDAARLPPGRITGSRLRTLDRIACQARLSPTRGASGLQLLLTEEEDVLADGLLGELFGLSD